MTKRKIKLLSMVPPSYLRKLFLSSVAELRLRYPNNFHDPENVCEGPSWTQHPCPVTHSSICLVNCLLRSGCSSVIEYLPSKCKDWGPTQALLKKKEENIMNTICASFCTLGIQGGAVLNSNNDAWKYMVASVARAIGGVWFSEEVRDSREGFLEEIVAADLKE